jgi:AcrR family transcriptional regulator
MLEQAQTLDPRDTIVRSSLEIFYRDGIKGTDVTKVIERAGVSESLFYQNFSSKEDLLFLSSSRRLLGVVQADRLTHKSGL